MQRMVGWEAKELAGHHSNTLHLGYPICGPQATDDSCPYAVPPSRLNDINGNKDMEALTALGGVVGLAQAIGSDIRKGLAQPSASGAANDLSLIHI